MISGAVEVPTDQGEPLHFVDLMASGPQLGLQQLAPVANFLSPYLVDEFGQFIPGADPRAAFAVRAVRAREDGSFVIGGAFNRVRTWPYWYDPYGSPDGWDEQRAYLAISTPNGELDRSVDFAPNGPVLALTGFGETVYAAGAFDRVERAGVAEELPVETAVLRFGATNRLDPACRVQVALDPVVGSARIHALLPYPIPTPRAEARGSATREIFES